MASDTPSRLNELDEDLKDRRQRTSTLDSNISMDDSGEQGIEASEGNDLLREKNEVDECVPKRKGPPRLNRLPSLSVQLDISEILDYLYLGAKAVSEDCDTLQNLGIGYIVNCTLESPNLFIDQGIEYHQVSVDDKVSANIAPFFCPAAEFIENARQKSSKVLVHCTMGMSRSSTVVIAYLMQYHGMNLATAMHLTKEKRAMVSPNSGFMAQLIDLEKNLFGTVTVDLEQYKKGRFAEVDSFTLKQT